MPIRRDLFGLLESFVVWINSASPTPSCRLYLMDASIPSPRLVECLAEQSVLEVRELTGKDGESQETSLGHVGFSNISQHLGSIVWLHTVYINYSIFKVIGESTAGEGAYTIRWTENDLKRTGAIRRSGKTPHVTVQATAGTCKVACSPQGFLVAITGAGTAYQVPNCKTKSRNWRISLTDMIEVIFVHDQS